jgi:hypothetical protein
MSFTIAAGPRQRSHSRFLVPYFTLSDWRLSQPGGPGSHIYIPQEEGGPVIPQGTGFPVRRLLRLAGLRWGYSNPRRGEPTEDTIHTIHITNFYHGNLFASPSNALFTKNLLP